MLRTRYRAMGLDGEVDPAKCQHTEALPGRPGDGYVPDELPWCPDCRTSVRGSKVPTFADPEPDA